MTSHMRPLIVDLPEGLLLLATDDQTGQIASKSGALDYGLAGAVLTELFLLDHLTTRNGKVVITGTGTTADPILADALARIADSKPRDAKQWVNRFSGDGIKDRVLDRLVEKGILRKEEHRILWIIPADRYPAADDSLERNVRDAIRATVLDGLTPQPRTAVLIGMLKACDLLDTVFSRDERKAHRYRIDQIADADLMSEAVTKAVKEMQAATMAAITAATTVAATSSSSN